MITAQIIGWMAAVQGVMAIAPDAVALAGKVKSTIDEMFRQGMISPDVQNTLHARVNTICQAALNGQEPDHWKVEPDPA